MHVAINAYFWNHVNSGSGQYTRNLVKYLNLLVSDLKITLIFPLYPGEQVPEDVPVGVALTAVAARPGYVGKVVFEQRGFPKACQVVGADLAHIPYWGAPLRAPVPLVVTIHDLITLLVPEYRRRTGAKLYNALVSASARGAAHIITDSEASKQDITTLLGIPETDVTPIYLAIDEAYKEPPSSLVEMAILRKYNLPDFYILYLGGYELHKNVTTLLLAWSYVAQALGDDYPLVLAGKKPTAVSEVYPDYDEYIRKLGIGDFVRWIGFVDEADKSVLYRNAETFVFPSRHEGFGLPVLEAMSCGTPVVTTDATSLPEIIGEAGFTIDPDDGRGMAGAIISSVIQDNLAQEMRQKSLEQAAKFSWERTVMETVAVYGGVRGDQVTR